MTIQNLQFELIKRATFNEFDGKKVVESLKANKDLWRGVIMGRFMYSYLIPLRDISDNYWNVDELFIEAMPGREKELFLLANTWSADTVSWIDREEISMLIGTSPYKGSVLYLWWD